MIADQPGARGQLLATSMRVKPTASDRRIGQRTPWNLAQEIALQEGRIGRPSAGGKSSPSRIRDALIEELLCLVDDDEAVRLLATHLNRSLLPSDIATRSARLQPIGFRP